MTDKHDRMEMGPVDFVAALRGADRTTWLAGEYNRLFALAEYGATVVDAGERQGAPAQGAGAHGADGHVSAELEAEVRRLRGLIDRDRTGLAAALANVVSIVRSYGWILDGEWGSYSYSERTAATLRKEACGALSAVRDAALRGLRDSGERADSAFHGPLDGVGARLPLLLWCPSCGARHIDRGEFATKSHHTHACQKCGMVWRPAVVETVGVEFLPAFKDAKSAAERDRGGGCSVYEWPLPLLLWCPSCGARHIDRGESEIKSHHTHACQKCGVMWRPAVVETAGVEFLPGFKDEESR